MVFFPRIDCSQMCITKTSGFLEPGDPCVEQRGKRLQKRSGPVPQSSSKLACPCPSALVLGMMPC